MSIYSKLLSIFFYQLQVGVYRPYNDLGHELRRMPERSELTICKRVALFNSSSATVRYTSRAEHCNCAYLYWLFQKVSFQNKLIKEYHLVCYAHTTSFQNGTLLERALYKNNSLLRVLLAVFRIISAPLPTNFAILQSTKKHVHDNRDGRQSPAIVLL